VSALRPVAQRWATQLAIVFSAVGLVLACIVWLGNLAREQIRENQRFQVAFQDIECDPPPGLTRAEFLEEVQYHARMPEHFSVLDDSVASQLKEGFAKHPWVAGVETIQLAPPRTARAVVVYRQAALAVLVDSDLAGTGDGASKRRLRGVDSSGILLPKKAPIALGLPNLAGAPRPAGAAGETWGDATVGAAAKAAEVLGPYWPNLGLNGMKWNVDGVVLMGPFVKVLWGQGGPGEATAADKTQRLLDTLAGKRPPVPWPAMMVELDVRRPGPIERRWVAMEKW
jgi:hypothetical protein